ncbi:MAG TPA: type III-B CRISPR module RAMP protein Cmr4 [Chloroflexi bacterium]|nr:type III-B CRISPR module RAMP protein Cmr4 [Chloroflexota bacterium]
MNARLLFVHALSPLHAGTGQGVGVVDLPIAREKATDLPFLPGSSVKGTLRDACQDRKKTAVFGPDTSNASDHAGSAQFSDQRLLLLPIRSLSGTFAWVTSPYILRRIVRDANDAGATGVPHPVPVPDARDKCLVPQNDCDICLKDAKDQVRVYLEDLDLQATTGSEVTQWADWLKQRIFADSPDWQRMLSGRFCIVHDDVMSFLLETATEITARVKLKPDTKTVDTDVGGLWYEESLPTETVLYGLVVATPIARTKLTASELFQVVEALTQQTLQFGGKATVGRGLCRLQMVKEGG